MVHSPVGFLFCLYNCFESKTSKGTDIGVDMIVLINKNSGGGMALKKWNRVYPQLNLNGLTETYFVGANGSSNEFVLEALNKGKTDFVIAGGDGSINYFLNHLINFVEPEILNEVKIGAVGIGSSNDFYKPFQSKNIVEKIPYKLNFRDAVKRDVGCLVFEKEGNLFKKYFLINASVGVTAEGNNFFNNPDFILSSLKKISTQSAISYAAIKNILTYKNFKATMEINNESFTTNISNVGILKSPFFTGKLRYQSDPLFDNGLFDIHLYESLSKVKLLKLFYNLSKGISDISLNKKFWRTDRVTISSETEFAVEFDGEVITTKTVEFSVIPRLIKVCTN
jgi:diacylglycerol kinase (ATP)